MRALIIITAIILLYGAFSTLFHESALAGNIGKIIGEANIDLFGYFAYANLLLLFIPLYGFYRHPRLLKRIDSYAGWLLLFLAIVVLQPLTIGLENSGLFARETYGALLPYIGTAGLWLFWLMITLLSLVLIIDDDFDFSEFFDRFRRTKSPAKKSKRKASGKNEMGLSSIYSMFRSFFRNPFDSRKEREMEGILGMRLDPIQESLHSRVMPSNTEEREPEETPSVDDFLELPAKTNHTRKAVQPRTSTNLTAHSGVQIVDELEENSRILAQIDRGKTQGPKNFRLPKLDFLQKPPKVSRRINEAEIDRKIGELLEKMAQFRIEGDVVRTYTGPLVTTFEFKPAPNVKVSKILSLQDDLAMALSAETIRIQAPIPGRDVVGIEIPNEKFETIYLRDILENDIFTSAKSELTVALGKDIVGKPFITDLKKLPHLLIAGTTGAGKSVGINAMILSLLYRNDPDHLKLIMIDPKMLEFSIYNDIPHLLTPVITDAKQAISALANMVGEMERRYRLMADVRVKNIENFNEKARHFGEFEPMPYIVIVIDELSDLMMNGGKEVEYSIARLAQMARASGIHLIVATQRPSVDVVTGLIKANLPSRLSYRVGQKVDSKVILDQMGAETLLGRGDALFTPPGSVGLVRLHAPWNTEEEIEKVVEFLKMQRDPEYDTSILMLKEEGTGSDAQGDRIDLDPLYEEARAIVLNDQKTSISYLQRKLQIGYNRSANIIEQLEAMGVLSAPNNKGNREIL